MRYCFGTLCFSSRLNKSAADEEAPQVLMNDGSATGNHVVKMATIEDLQVGLIFINNRNFVGVIVFLNCHIRAVLFDNREDFFIINFYD